MPQPVMIPVPPREPHQTVTDLLRKTTAQGSGRTTGNNHPVGYIMDDNRARCNNGTMANTDFRLHDGTMPDPGVMPNFRPPGRASGKEIPVGFGIIPVIF